MDLDKAWLYHQGSWTEVDDPAAQFPEEIDELFEKLHYNPAPRTYGVPGEHYVTIYYGPLFPEEKGAPIAYPDYPYYIEVGNGGPFLFGEERSDRSSFLHRG